MATREQVEAVASWLRVFVQPGGLTELRAVGTPEGTVAGWFDYQGIDAMARHAVALTPRAKSVYFTINPIKADADIPGLRRLGQGQVGKVNKGECTEDAHIARRLWAPIDIDPVRVGASRKSSSTDTERAAAWAVVDRVVGTLRAGGLPPPVIGDSGNGWHVCQPIDLPNDDASREFVRQLLAGLHARCGDAGAEVDKTTFNAARIWKVYGTVARKGDDSPDRPHRQSKLLDL